jgi:hypothetical protein
LTSPGKARFANTPLRVAQASGIVAKPLTTKYPERLPPHRVKRKDAKVRKDRKVHQRAAFAILRLLCDFALCLIQPCQIYL